MCLPTIRYINEEPPIQLTAEKKPDRFQIKLVLSIVMAMGMYFFVTSCHIKSSPKRLDECSSVIMQALNLCMKILWNTQILSFEPPAGFFIQNIQSHQTDSHSHLKSFQLTFPYSPFLSFSCPQLHRVRKSTPRPDMGRKKNPSYAMLSAGLQHGPTRLMTQTKKRKREKKKR